jgi:exonuclease SbcC
MRILRIRLRNLNSLKGEHQLDLTDEPLASAGLFAITGPTGAGKTTLLDAVTLALYGKAARYGNESNPEHVMTRHCGECSAEVEFEVPSGVYRAVWERHRAGKKADGRLQQPKRYIYDIDGEPLAQQIREAEDKIEELLGLDYDRFLRSVLLAQGDFARFLKAKPDKRAELLESLTGTAIYSRLGKLAHTEARQMEDDLRSKDASLDLIEILQEEARQELEAALQEGDKQRASLTTAIKAGAEMLDKINTLERARRDEKRAADEQAAIGSDRQSAAEDLERLRTHRLTLPFAEDLARLESAESARRSAAENRKRTDAAHAAATKTLIQSNHILRTAIEAALEDCRERANSAGESAAEAAIVASDARSWLDEHQYDTSLDHQLGDVVAAIGELKSSRASLDSDWARWRSVAVAALSDAASGLPEQLDSMTESEAGPILADLLKKAGSEQEALDAEEKEARNQNGLRKDHLEKAKLVASLKDHRHTLKSGEPCPLCGALEHPYAETGAPKSEISALEEELEKAGEKLEKVRESYRAFTGTLKDLMSRKERILEGIRHSVAYRENLDVLLRPLGAEPPAPGSEDTLRTELQDRVRAYRQRSEAETDARKRQETADRTAKEAAREAKAFEKKLGKLPALPTDAILESLPAEELPGVAEAEEAYVDSVSQE